MMIGGSLRGALVAAACLSGNAASAQVYGNWTVGSGQGYVEYIVRSGPSSSVNISCDEGATGEGEAKRTSIFIEIAGTAPPPRSTVDVLTDGERLQLDTDAQGMILTDCRACADRFAALWSRLRASKQMIVALADGRRAAFRLSGAAKALEPKHCATGFKS
ncbi:hypothetical protein ABID82_000809 [Methylobacterium sp. PvP062]|uniref:Uncharacterized protein n=2 Tax=Methylobacterium radiotolerans TaxID=31998 RepID=A0ABV2NHJ5_9HYPH|nr:MULTISPECIES: hypothetical protein [unclassified Methylobacterium]MBP2497293.1 hypothetical protein [Methylobacterium sp. PvP105]MBP2502836.1 hypothetical protein [Methylobacterium sp. PvP109]MCX7333740.1 hypothetical protein [Hyphomicrobiales bacterium]